METQVGIDPMTSLTSDCEGKSHNHLKPAARTCERLLREIVGLIREIVGLVREIVGLISVVIIGPFRVVIGIIGEVIWLIRRREDHIIVS